MIKLIAIHPFPVHGVGIGYGQLKINSLDLRGGSRNHFLENIQFLIHVMLSNPPNALLHRRVPPLRASACKRLLEGISKTRQRLSSPHYNLFYWTRC